MMIYYIMVSKTLSNFDMDKFLGHKSNILTYKDLKKFDNIDEALKNYGYIILLYLTKDNFGHWTLIFKYDKNTIHFFDSYGLKPDSQIKFIPPVYKIKNGLSIPYLTYLLYNSGYHVKYNEFQFQQKKNYIATCGRHVLFRLINKDLDEYQYKKLLDILKKRYNFKNYDDLIVYLTNDNLE